MTHPTYPHLLSPIRLGPITLRHRAIMSGHGMALGDGQVGMSDRFQAYLMARAQGGAAMVGSESAPVHASTSSRSLGIRLYDDAVIPSLRRSAEAIRAVGSRLAITLWHGGHKDSFIRGGVALAPSPVPNLAGEVPKQINAREIRELITAYGDAAKRCATAGLDAIELQTSTDYLLGSFLSPVLNRRTDAYGGSFENRIRFVRQILESIREHVGQSIAVGIRTSARHHIPGATIDYGLEESVASMKALADAGLVDFVSVMIGSGWSPPESSSIANMAYKRVQLRDEGKAFKQALKVPVMIAGRIRTPEEAEQVIAEGTADIVAMARTWIADPDWGAKVESGNAHRIRPCMSCNQACVGYVFRGMPGSCVLNPVAGRESELGDAGTTIQPRTVAVIGGGPAGLEAARVLALRGHRVALYEKDATLGGQFRLAVNAPHRAEMKPALAWWQDELERLQVRVHLNQTVTNESDVEADTVIWATGARPGPTAVWRLRPYLLDGIPGTAGLPHGRDVLSGRVAVRGKVLVIDEEGGWPAVSLVETLAAHPNVSHVTVTTPERALADALLTLTWEIKTVAARLRQPKITIQTETLVKSVSKGIAALANGQNIGPFDAILMNTGTVAPNLPEDMLAIGDCVAPRGIWAATSDAVKLARTI
jgi:2,4-dienoyl-CoA reductase-like NADH-dependent reductase (Old Yellow Enzyme family)